MHHNKINKSDKNTQYFIDLSVFMLHLAKYLQQRESTLIYHEHAFVFFLTHCIKMVNGVRQCILQTAQRDPDQDPPPPGLIKASSSQL